MTTTTTTAHNAAPHHACRPWCIGADAHECGGPALDLAPGFSAWLTAGADGAARIALSGPTVELDGPQARALAAGLAQLAASL